MTIVIGSKVNYPYRWQDRERKGQHMAQGIELTNDEGVGIIRLNRPDKGNSFTPEMVDEWAAWLRHAKGDPKIGAVVLTGTGDKIFCAGADFAVLGGEESVSGRKARLTEHVHQVALAVEEFDKPLIAAVNGAATGAGMDMALMCDMRFAAPVARFSESYIKVGLVPGDGGAFYLPRIVGIAKALELLMSGEFIDAQEALRIGLVNRVCEGDVLEESIVFARKLCELAPYALRLIKRTTYQSARIDLRTSLDMVSSHMGIVHSLEDTKEALNAFREKRKPEFKGC